MKDSKMYFCQVLWFFLVFEGTSALLYEESISDLLVQCNSYQRQTSFKNRTAHSCEKEDPDGDFRYFITPMKADYSKRDFLCVLFFKNGYSRLNFRLLFTHQNFTVDAVRILRHRVRIDFEVFFAVRNKIQQPTRVTF